MYVGDKNSINLTSSKFANFIENNCLYVDKTAFIEHVLRDTSDVLLFTRPRRMGKSLNMNTLATFLDCKRDTARLFRGLHIEGCPEFGQVNSHPVVYLDFVTLDSSNLVGLRQSFRMQILGHIEKLLDLDNAGMIIRDYINGPDNHSPNILSSLLEAIKKHYQKEPYLIIDEYDKVIMDTLNHREGDEIKAFVVNALQSALKGETHFKKAVLTGVTRTTKESLFSTLNNIEVYDILTPSVYDTDFSLTEGELLELVPKKDIAGVRNWYNNMRVGDAWLYNIYSVMNYLSKPRQGLRGYWSMSGGGNLLSSLWTEPRAEAIKTMLSDDTYRHATVLDHHLNMEHLRDVSRCDDKTFYTLGVQAGYLTFEPLGGDVYRVFIPNVEAKQVWARLLLDYRYKGDDSKLAAIFAGIGNVDTFSRQLTDFVSMVLSYNDFKESAEWVYHVFFLGLVYSSLGYECKSNLEAGLGRFDIALKAPRFAAVIEFKVAKGEDDKAMQAGVKEALSQIDEKEYWREFRNSAVPVYKIGISCYGKKCLAGTVLHKNPGG